MSKQLNAKVGEDVIELLRVAAFWSRMSKSAIIVEAVKEKCQRIIEEAKKREEKA